MIAASRNLLDQPDIGHDPNAFRAGVRETCSESATHCSDRCAPFSRPSSRIRSITCIASDVAVTRVDRTGRDDTIRTPSAARARILP